MLALAAALVLSLMVCGAAFGQVQIDEASVGFAGRFRLGHWTPVHVSLQAMQEAVRGRLELIAPDGEGTPTATDSRPVEMAAGTKLATTVYAKFGRVRGGLTVNMRADDGALLASRRYAPDQLAAAVLGSQEWVVTLGADVGGQAAAQRRGKQERQTVHVAVTDAACIPDRWIGYAGVSLVVLPAGETGLARHMSPPQLDALDRWVRMGGRLLLSTGASAATMLADGGPLARFAPGRFDRVTMQRQTSGLESFAGGNARRLDTLKARGELTFRMPLALLSDVRGRVEADESFGGQRTPTIIRASHGFGQVVFLGLDLDQPPLSDWTEGRSRLLGRLFDLSLGPVPGEDDSQPTNRLIQIGFDDIVGQLRSALEQFAGVRFVPFYWIALLVGVYVFLIGPVDYLVLRRWNKRFGWTWLTFPLFVLIGCAAAVLLTRTWKGDQLRVNQLDVVDVDVESGLLRGSAWAHVFSPRGRKYDLQLEPPTAAGPIDLPRGSLLSWQGLPGDSFGGMNTRRLDESGQIYQVLCDFDSTSSQTAKLQGLPIDTYASRALYGQYWGRVDLPAWGALTADANNQLLGEIRNPLDSELRDCRLCFDRWVYELPSIPPRGARLVGSGSMLKTIEWWLTRSRIDQDNKELSQPWNRQSLELDRIAQVMMFHQASGGFNYTGLLQRFQRDVDFSDHLRQGRAVLLARSSEPASRLTSGGRELAAGATEVAVRENHTTFYRLLLPVVPMQR